MEQNKDQSGAVIAWMRPDEIDGLLEAAKSESATRQYGRIYAKQYDPDMVPVCGAAVRGEAVACKFCDGEGVIHTGIDEAPSRECRRCDGSGIATVSARAADAPSEPSELAKRLRSHASLFKVGCEPYSDVLAAADALDSQPAERAINDAVKIAVSALKEISEWSFGWDGDCGVTTVADTALEAIEAAQASSQPTDVGVRNGRAELAKLLAGAEPGDAT